MLNSKFARFVGASFAVAFIFVVTSWWPVIASSINTFGPTTAAAVVALFTGCSGTQYLGADSACHAAGGSGTVNAGTAHQTGVYSSAGTAISGAGPGTSGQCLTSNGAGADPTYQSCAGGSGTVSAGTANQPAFYASAGTTVSGFGPGSAGQCYTSNGSGAAPTFNACGGIPTFTAIVPGNWSALGSGGAVATVTGTQGGNALQITGLKAVSNWFGQQTTVAGTSWTKTFAIYPSLDATNPSNAGVVVGFTDGTKVEGAYVIANGLSTYSISIGAVSTTNVTGGTIANAVGLTGAYVLNGGPIMIQCTRATNTYSCTWAPDGVNFTTTLFSEAVPFLTATGAAVIASNRNATSSLAAPIVLLESFN